MSQLYHQLGGQVGKDGSPPKAREYLWQLLLHCMLPSWQPLANVYPPLGFFHTFLLPRLLVD